MTEWLYDAIAIVGLIAITVGIGFEFSWPWAAIIFGVVALLAAIKGSINNATQSDISKQTDNDAR
jgi:hypothetical protein